jgi:hypothetical protein
MNREDIIRMAEEASGGRQPDGWGVMLDHEQLERFANLVAAAEREMCAAVCDKLGDEYADANPADCAFVIRERGAP